MQSKGAVSLITISLIIPTYNRSEILIETVRHYLNNFPDDGELIIIDQSQDRNLDIVELSEIHPFVKYMQISEKGLPNARNIGSLAASGEIIVYTDDDVIPSTKLLAAYKRAFEDPMVGGAAGRVCLANASNMKTKSERPRIRQVDGKIFSNFDQDKKMSVDHAQGCNMAFRRSLVVEVGGFDKRFGGSAHLEETDLCMRIKALGYKIVYLPNASLIHLVHESGGCRSKDMSSWLYWYGHNYTLFYLKNFNKLWFPVFAAERIIKLFFSAISQRRLAHLTNGLLGIWHGLKIYRKRI